MKKFLILTMLSVCVFSLAHVNATTVYKKVNSDGSIEYSDKPFEGAKPVKLKDTSQQTTLPTTPAVTSVKATTTKKPPVKFNITIESPANGDTIRDNQGNFTIVVQKQGKPKVNYKTQISINGTAVGKPTQAAVINMKNIDRGELKLKAQLLSSSGKVLATSSEKVVYLHRISVIRSN